MDNEMNNGTNKLIVSFPKDKKITFTVNNCVLHDNINKFLGKDIYVIRNIYEYEHDKYEIMRFKCDRIDIGYKNSSDIPFTLYSQSNHNYTDTKINDYGYGYYFSEEDAINKIKEIDAMAEIEYVYK